MNGQRSLVLGLCIVGLSGCNTMNSAGDYSYETSGGYYSATHAPNLLYLPTSSSSSYSYDDYSSEQDSMMSDRKEVTVPETYHVGPYHSPALAKDRDRSWVTEQNPQGYTIEIADGNKASQVAGQLVQAPKKERMAEVQYYRNGNPYYKGLYGSYSTYEAAQQAFESLPGTLKQQAGVKRWSEVQGAVGE